MDEIFLNVFPLSDVVLFPHASLPLNIFEPRYIKMIHDSINTNTPIAIAMTNFFENEQFILKSSTGDFSNCIVGYGMPQIIQQNLDGSMFVMLRGLGKARLKEKREEKPYRVYSAVDLNDDEVFENENRFKLNRLKMELKIWLEDNIKLKEDRDTFFKKINSPSELFAYAAHFLIEDPKTKQEILESNDVNQKLEILLSSIIRRRPDNVPGKLLPLSNAI
jgi:Lon protease-like protein